MALGRFGLAEEGAPTAFTYDRIESLAVYRHHAEWLYCDMNSGRACLVYYNLIRVFDYDTGY